MKGIVVSTHNTVSSMTRGNPADEKSPLPGCVEGNVQPCDGLRVNVGFFVQPVSEIPLLIVWGVEAP